MLFVFRTHFLCPVFLLYENMSGDMTVQYQTSEAALISIFIYWPMECTDYWRGKWNHQRNFCEVQLWCISFQITLLASPEFIEFVPPSSQLIYKHNIRKRIHLNLLSLYPHPGESIYQQVYFSQIYKCKTIWSDNK